MSDETEIAWHRDLIAKNLPMLEALEAGEITPETQSEIDHLKQQLDQSELIVAAYEKKNAEEP